ncbi:MAG: hypothetical protein M3430_07170, partial [Acidobacteriota bacterium]|nr:hypothetical protein [Acidobacteriota bacterium]
MLKAKLVLFSIFFSLGLATDARVSARQTGVSPAAIQKSAAASQAPGGQNVPQDSLLADEEADEPPVKKKQF